MQAKSQCQALPCAILLIYETSKMAHGGLVIKAISSSDELFQSPRSLFAH